MTHGPFGSVLRHLERVAGAPWHATLSDRQLLGRFAADRDEAAFAALVQRHGRLVLGVCRLVLGHAQDAEDVFQATFLVLARKAGSGHWHDSVGNWLYEVAYRLAVHTRADALRRRAEERRAGEMRHEARAESDAAELPRILDEELRWLPEKLRAPLLLCYLEGRTRDEAAEQLGCPLGTLKHRLESGRELLRKRLTRRGVSLSAALLTAALEEGGVAVGNELAGATVRAAVAFALSDRLSGNAAVLAERAMHSLLATKGWRLAVVLFLLFGAAVCGAGVLASHPGDVPLGGEPAVRAKARVPQKLAAVDNQGDPLPPGARVRLGTVRFRHGGGVRAVTFLGDGTVLVSADEDGAIRLWEAATGKALRRLTGHKDEAYCLAVDPAGKLLASGGADRTIRLWDLQSGKGRELGKHPRPVLCVAFSRDGSYLASGDGSVGKPGEVRLWDRKSDKVIRVFPHGGEVFAVAFSPDGKTLATASADKVVRLLEVPSGKELRSWPAANASRAVAFSPDGKLLAWGGSADPVVLWDVRKNEEIARLPGPVNTTLALAFSPDGKALVAGELGGAVYRWDLTTRPPQRTLWPAHRGPVMALAFRPDGKALASAGSDHTVRVWAPDGSKEQNRFGGHEGEVSRLALAPDGDTIASASWTDGSVRLWSRRARKQIARWEVRASLVGGLTYSPDGKRLAVGNGDGSISLRDAASGKEIHRLEGHNRRVAGLVFSPDGKTLVSASQDSSVRLWDVASGEERRQFVGHADEVAALAMTADGKALFSASHDQTLRRWDVATGNLVREFRGHQHGVTCVALSPRGDLLASGSYDRTVRLWDPHTGASLHALPHEGPVYAVVFSPDGRTLATGSWPGGEVRLYEVATRQERHRLEGHQAWIPTLAFAADGKTLVSGSADTTILVWDVTAWTEKKKEYDLSPAEMGQLWEHLAGADAKRAYRAMRALLAAPKQAVPWIREHLHPVKAADPGRTAKLIDGLNDTRFLVRKESFDELEKLGDAAEPALRERLAGPVPLEIRRRIEVLLRKLEASGGRLQAARAVEILERLAARDVLAELARGAPGAWLTGEARRSLGRLGEQAKAP